MGSKDQQLGLYQCGWCKAEYSRADHLIRHVRGHTQQRPYVCTICSKGFARQDLLKRHETTHDRDSAQPSPKRPKLSGQPGSHSHRVHQACRSCAAKKLKCTEEKPCKRCKQKKIPCDYDDDGFGDAEVQLVMPDVPRHDQGEFLNNEPRQSTPIVDSGAGQPAFDVPTLTHDRLDLPPPSFADGGFLGPNTFLQDVLECASAIPGYGSHIDFESDASLHNMNFDFLDQLDTSWVTNNTPAQMVDTSPAKIVALGSEAYKSSASMSAWVPRHEENSGLEHQNLVLPDNVATTRPPSRAAKRLPHDSLSVATRDRILSMILETTSRATTRRIIASFPATEILTNLIHHAFVQMREKQISDFIHVPSFKMNSEPPELLGALIAYGAVSSPSSVVRKFGYALQEAVRVAIQTRFEEDNANLRRLGMTQAFYLQLTIGYFSAVGRKIEMAESFSMLGVTILRRGGKLRRAYYSPIGVGMSDSGESLHQQWLRWVEQESMKRLVYFALTLDAQISMSRNVNTLFSSAEIGTPLPAFLDLWSAETASDWKEALLNKGQVSTDVEPSLAEVLQNMSLLTTYQHDVDLQYGGLIVLGGLWSLIREFRQMSALLERSRCWNDFVLSSRHTELCSVLQQFRMESADWEMLSPEVQILQEVSSMHLYVSFEVLSNYAGRGSEEEARKATSYVEQWFQSSDSRSAIWHGGQVLRGAKKMVPSSLTDTYAIALYHAAVVLWVYGVMKRTQGDSLGATLPRLLLDGEESHELSRFVSRNRGTPGLTGKGGEFIAVVDPASVADLVKDVVQENWKHHPFPLTTEEVFRLMQGFSDAIRRNVF